MKNWNLKTVNMINAYVLGDNCEVGDCVVGVYYVQDNVKPVDL